MTLAGPLGIPLWIVVIVLPIVCAVASGCIWRAKGGDVADGIALGGILNVLGLLIAIVRHPKHHPGSRTALPRARI